MYHPKTDIVLTTIPCSFVDSCVTVMKGIKLSGIGDIAARILNQSEPNIAGNISVHIIKSGTKNANVGLILSFATFACICFM